MIKFHILSNTTGDKFVLNIYQNKYSKNLNDLSKYSVYKYGDVLSLRGKITIPEKLGNPYEFDYKKYLNSKNIISQISTYDVELVNVKKSNVFLKIIYSFKDRVSDRIDSIMPDRESNLFKSMLYGDDKFLDEDIKDDFEKSGLSHLLAVSGSNLAMIIMIISYQFLIK